MNRHPFSIDEWYHCFNRGVDKRVVFNDQSDYWRFLSLLYLVNDNEKPLNIRDDYKGSTFEDLFTAAEHGETLVDIGCYCLMPNHFHLLLREKRANGISVFMQKLGTAYTMYFNKINERTGALFAGRFKAKHVHDDRYLKRVCNYIHANAAELVEHGWEQGVIRTPALTSKYLGTYPYSSLPDYLGTQRPQASIIAKEALLDCYDSPFPGVQQLLEEAVIFTKESEYKG